MDKAYNINQIETVFDLLVSDSPYLKKNWDEYYNKEYKDSRERLLYFDMMAISAFVIELFQKKKSKDLQSFFDKVEIVLKDADSEVKNLILSGLIEGIQQICQYENIDMRYEFNTWLSPLTQKNWDEITDFFTFDSTE
ncbi:hypothetical protein LF887_19705 [Chryseobacterium sp. MEBOG06]|uniref:DUF7674 family protein n=1 Tax=Chryseobacterium sp. MEBOG06 TaxID=2879938 RepID=UPI001F33D379|nr:hypothetical protein [Chryseobacterium sp. MEBOG06]UKB83216.1 hypothetical protein LF887_19705 [Chryseobacterium sp. MEBOG06]